MHACTVYLRLTIVNTTVLSTMMGATPSSAVQQTAYLEGLDQYIDYDEDGKLRKCLMDENGVQLRDAEGNLKTLRHRFAIYCDDIAAGVDTDTFLG
jgi:hypothetical protein